MGVFNIFRQMEPTANGVTRSVKLFSIDLTGYNEREIVTPLDASDQHGRHLTHKNERSNFICNLVYFVWLIHWHSVTRY